jgi:hypothetical protein
VLPSASANGLAAPLVLPEKPNPSASLDLTLGITVLSFHDADGQVVASMPTRQQLNTYLMFGAPGQAARADAAEGSPGLGLLA